MLQERPQQDIKSLNKAQIIHRLEDLQKKVTAQNLIAESRAREILDLRQVIADRDKTIKEQGVQIQENGKKLNN